MSLIPFTTDFDDNDIFDPWYQSLGSYFDPNFAVTVYPQELRTARRLPRYLRTPGYRRNWKLDKKDRTTPSVVVNKDGFQLCMDVEQFAPNEISVKTVDKSIVIEGKHEEREDDHGFISRHFVRRYQLPKGFDVNDVISTLSSDGVLTVKAPPVAKSIKNKEKVIQIQQTGPAHLNVKDTSKEEEKMTE